MDQGFKFLKHIIWFTQLGLSVVSPLVLFVLGAVWLRNRFGIGGWIVILGILFGVLGAVSGLWSSLKAMNHSAKAEDKEKPISFNDHE